MKRLTPPPHNKSPPGLLNCQAFEIFRGGFYLGEATIKNFVQKFAKKVEHEFECSHLLNYSSLYEFDKNLFLFINNQ
jgi:hypothetical protein